MAVVERTNTDGTANSSTSLPVHTSSMLLVKRSSCGMTIPGRLGCTRVAERLSTSVSMADHTCTSLPLTVSIRARAMPQVPAPRTPILNFFTFVSSVSAPGRSSCRWICAVPSRCPAAAHCYVHCTRKHPQRQASAALHKYLTSLCNFSVTSRVLCKPFALRGISCYYSILVGFVGIGDSVS